MKAAEKLKKGSTSLRDLRAFFNSIPKRMWCTGTIERMNGRRCALGHLSVLIYGIPMYRPLKIVDANSLSLADWNDSARSDDEAKEVVIHKLDEYIRKRYKPS